MEYNCTCGAGYRGEVYHCPLHAAAQDMYEALKDARNQIEYLHDKLGKKTGTGVRCLSQIEQALSLAEGKEV